MKKNGFVSTSLIYTFFIIFLSMMVFLLNSYSRTRYLMDEIKHDIKSNFASLKNGDVNIYFMVYDNITKEYELNSNMPLAGYNYNPDFSYCKNGSTINFVNGNIVVEGIGKDACYAYFKGNGYDIDLKIYIKESADSEKILVNSIPNVNYDFTKSECNNDVILNFDTATRTFNANTNKSASCEVLFTKNNAKVELNYYQESLEGTHNYNNINYKLVNEAPTSNYHFDSFLCQNADITTNIIVTNNGLYVESSGENTCNIYYNKGENKVNITIMEETEDGMSGFTTGKKYSRVFNIPNNNYKYVGSICTPDTIKVEYLNNRLIPTYDVPGDCYAYFDLANNNVVINYYIKNAKGDYDLVKTIPKSGYIFNSTKSICGLASSKIKPYNNYVSIEAENDDICNIYYDEVQND